MDGASPTANRRVVALVRSVHGLHGTVRVEVLTDHPEERFAPGARLFREGSGESLTIATGEPVPDGPGWRLRFRGLADRSSAEGLRGVYLEADLAPRPTTPDTGEAGGVGAEVWWDEVIGVPVTSPDGGPLGVVRDVYRAGAADVYAVEGGPRGDFELPAVRDYILEFAPRDGRIVADPIALDLPAAARGNRPRGRRTVRAAKAGRRDPAPDDGPDREADR